MSQRWRRVTRDQPVADGADISPDVLAVADRSICFESDMEVMGMCKSGYR